MGTSPKDTLPAPGGEHWPDGVKATDVVGEKTAPAP